MFDLTQITLTLIWVFLVFILYGIRTVKVIRFGFKVIEHIGRVNQREIADGDYETWRVRWDAFKKVSESRIILEFWHPIRDFYPEMIRPPR